MAEYDTKPGASPDQELWNRLTTLERTVDRLQGQIDRGDTWQSWIPVFALVNLTSTSYIQYAFSYGGYWNQDVLDVRAPVTFNSGTGHTWRIRTADGLYTLTDSTNRTGTGTHRLLWLHPYQTHPEDYRYQPGSSSVMRLTPPSFIALDIAITTGPGNWTAWIPMSRAVSAEIETTATTAGVFSYA